MERYIGVKLVEAEAQKNPETGEAGYRLRDPDGRERWYPADEFELEFLPLWNEAYTRIPYVSEDTVREFVAETDVTTMGRKTTVVRAVLRNGYAIVKSSSCDSEAGYSEAVGTEICMKRIERQVWGMLNFLLRTAVNGFRYRQKGDSDHED